MQFITNTNQSSWQTKGGFRSQYAVCIQFVNGDLWVIRTGDTFLHPSQHNMLNVNAFLHRQPQENASRNFYNRAPCEQRNTFHSNISFYTSSRGMYLTFTGNKSSIAVTRTKKTGSNRLLCFMSCNTSAIKCMLLISHQHRILFITNHVQISWRLCSCNLDIPLINFIDKSNGSLDRVLLIHAEYKVHWFTPGDSIQQTIN